MCIFAYYYTTLMTLWEKLEHYHSISQCSCPTPSSCLARWNVGEFRSEDYVVWFLTILNDQFSRFRFLAPSWNHCPLLIVFYMSIWFYDYKIKIKMKIIMILSLLLIVGSLIFFHFQNSNWTTKIEIEENRT